MTEEPRRPTVRVVFEGPGQVGLKVEMDEDVTVGQLQLAGLELTALGSEARQGHRVQEAQRRLETMAVAAQLRNGRPA